MEITYNSNNFPVHFGPDFQGANTFQFSVQELMWAALTVGRANYMDVLSHGIYSEYEILYRASILVANLAMNGVRLVKSSAYESLDPSEKSAVSYFLGLTFTKLLAEKLLRTPWLLHIDVYKDQFSRSGMAFGFGSSRMKPDLIGLDDRRRWIVCESKGRTNNMESSLLGKAKSQTRNLRRIGIDLPYLRVAVVTHFANGELVVDWEDPEGYNDHSFDLKTDRADYLLNYYRLIFNILSNNQVAEFGRFVTYTFDAVNLTIGLEKTIFDSYKANNLGEIRPTRLLTSDEQKGITEQETFSGSDGIFVGLGRNWRDLIRANKRFNQ